MNALNQLDAQVGDRHRLVWTEAALKAIHHADVDLSVWRRGFDAPFSAWAQRVAERRELSLDEVVPLDALPLERWFTGWRTTAGLTQFKHDLQARAASYGRLMRCERGRVQVHVVKQQQCPRFHLDNVDVRLICTYAGPATEWVPETALDRRRLRTVAVHEAPTREGSTPRQLERFDVALMKGCAFKGNDGFGLVHRSPPIAGGPRLVLTIDGRR